jgi:hypothetical protein
MRKRLWLVAAAILVLVGIVSSGLLLVYAGQKEKGVTRALYERIEVGMDYADVDYLLGVGLGPTSLFESLNGSNTWSDGGPDRIHVAFDMNRKVEFKRFEPGSPWARFKYQLRKRLPKSWQ